MPRVIAHQETADLFNLTADGVFLGTCGVQRRQIGLSRFSAWEVVLGPWRVQSADTDVPTVIRAVLRTVMQGDTPWHQLTVQHDGIDPAAFDTIWRYATRLGLSCEITPQDQKTVAIIWGDGPKAKVKRALFARDPSPPPGAPWPGFRYSRLDLRITPPHQSPLSLVPLEESDLMTGQYQLGLTPSGVEAALHRGDVCYALKEGGQVAFSMWISLDQAFLASLIPQSLIAPRSCYAYGAFTIAERRRQGLYGRGLGALAILLRPKADWIMLRTNPENLDSIRVTAKAGFIKVDP